MTVDRKKPIFNLKAVVQETGIRPDTLRAWERRYGIPDPERAESGHRLYSRYEIDVVKWLLERQDEGMTISSAVALWRQLEDAGENPLAGETSDSPGAEGVADSSRDLEFVYQEAESLGDLRRDWISACLAFDERRAEQILASAFAMFPVETVVKQILLGGIAEIGDGWHAGRVTVQQEHFATGLAVRRLDTLIAASPLPTQRDRILIACPSNETHSLAALVLTLLLRRRGWDVVNLGADVPVQSLEITIRTMQPGLVIMTAQQLHTAAGLLDAAAVAKDAGVPLAYGGLIYEMVPSLTEVVPGHYLGQKLDSAVTTVEQVMSAPRPRAASRSVSDMNFVALAHFGEKHARIEAAALEAVGAAGDHRQKYTKAAQVLGRDIAAALRIGDIGVLDAPMGPTDSTSEFNRILTAPERAKLLDGYLRACEQYMDARGAPIVRWLNSVTGAATSAHQTPTTVFEPTSTPRRAQDARIDDGRYGHDRQQALPEFDRGRPSSNGTYAQSGQTNGKHG